MTAHVLSVNIGQPREIEWQGRRVTTAIWKDAVPHRVALRGVNFIGDDQADRTVHGGRDKAVYAYAQEDYDFWRTNENIATANGLFGENLTVAGIDLSNTVVGTRWTVGSAVLQATQPRLPCYKLGIRMGDAHFLKRFLRAQRVGAYFRIIEEGDVGANDPIAVVHTPAHGITLRFMVASLEDERKAEMLREIPDLPRFWQHVANGK